MIFLMSHLHMCTGPEARRKTPFLNIFMQVTVKIFSPNPHNPSIISGFASHLSFVERLLDGYLTFDKTVTDR